MSHILFNEEGVPRKLEDQWVRPIRPEYLALGSMSKERAQYVLDNCNTLTNGEKVGFKYAFRHEWLGDHCHEHEDGINEVEDAYIKMVWSMMDNSKSYYDAVISIANGA